jgi:hypothetical protein
MSDRWPGRLISWNSVCSEWKDETNSVFPIWPRIADLVGMFTSYMALEGSREDKGEAVCTVLYACIAYFISNGRVSEVRQRPSLVRRGITTENATISLLCWNNTMNSDMLVWHVRQDWSHKHRNTALPYNYMWVYIFSWFMMCRQQVLWLDCCLNLCGPRDLGSDAKKYNTINHISYLLKTFI